MDDVRKKKVARKTAKKATSTSDIEKRLDTLAGIVEKLAHFAGAGEGFMADAPAGGKRPAGRLCQVT